ncbi:hypothetical protein HSACCH_00836 [Halanaerobium saccharolyticum subsp. saccharolyticum DSM 6643]|uniref:Uncharacterized protein n=1 Tax=Halanaerobium saccharolyticum subsp. saccharolyticum DSM 6643 TaxID=1293054 RepID=M5ECT4_9FIRM|nr:hypothetical protein [Halanaerobium saccharolyticum]CCU78697.1 hypothetical protein HSACCH_00836 [Halanaerobium saccharolyticum subsp. saccharolyticum DSM 6643]
MNINHKSAQFINKKAIRYFSIITLIFILELVLLSGSVEIVNAQDNTFISGQIKVRRGNAASNVKNALVKIGEKKAITDENGHYKISDLKGNNIKIKIYTGSSVFKSSSNSDNDKIFLWQKTIAIKPGENTLNITLNPIISILKYYSDFHEQETWQIAFYAYSNTNKKIESGKIITPNDKEYKMEPHFNSQWHKWWNLNEKITGNYIRKINFEDGTKESFSLIISEADFNMDFPELKYPTSNQNITTKSPIFKYDFSSVNQAYLRIEVKNKDDKWERLDRIILNNNKEYKIKDNILEFGNKYRWTIQTVISAGIIPWKEAKAPYKYFQIQKN